MGVPRTIKTAMPEEDFNLWDEGKKVAKKKLKPRPEPKAVKDSILALDKIDLNSVTLAVSGKRNVKKNQDGVRFIGFDVSLQMKGDKNIAGWMPENEYLELRRLLTREGLVNVDNLE